MRQWPTLALLGLAAVLGLLGLLAWHHGAPGSPGASSLAAPPAPRFVGAETCAGCHAAETGAWRGSQHAQSMQHATAATVLGDFGDARFEQRGTSARFLRRGGDFVVRTAGADGKVADFKVSHTFGVFPLQQYLVAFPDGRLQALPFAWDSRPASEGGGRWFHLYPDEDIKPGDPLHWTRLNQNWNWMCADCHSTDLQRNYDAATDRYQTTFAEMNVACEACHGPGSNHVAWARNPTPATATDPHHGLVVALDERKGAAWIPVPETGNARRSPSLAGHRTLAACAQCHARRAPLVAGMDHQRDLFDTHELSLLEAGRYFDDGQQREEVYNVGSFLQSRMHAAGVTCTDCHDPHSGKLRLAGNQVCSQCHAPAKYDQPRHTLHPAGTAGAACASCHMPTRAYMVIDQRHDHSFRIPRPDLGAALGTPDACTSCHRERDQAWAAAVIERAFGPTRKGFQTFAPALHAARTGAADAPARLTELVADPGVPAIARATALREMRNVLRPGLLASIERGLADRDPLVRAAAVDALQAAPVGERLRLALPLAEDPAYPVRVKVGAVLAPVDLATQDATTQARLQQVFDAYVHAQEANIDRPESRYNLGLFHAERGDIARATADYRGALALQPDFAPAYANLAELYRQTGQDNLADATLSEGLAKVPGDPALLHAQGLLRVRQKRLPEALDLLARAARGDPANPRYAYILAVALHDGGRRAEALQALQRARARFPGDADIANAFEAYRRE